MTEIERQDYRKLDRQRQESYDFHKRQHPDWDHAQLISRVGIDKHIDDAVNNGGDIQNGKFWERILIQTRKWLVEMNINPTVISALDNAVRKLTDMISRGVEWLSDRLSDVLNWLFE